jgi:tRNA(adenine34) deaminase
MVVSIEDAMQVALEEARCAFDKGEVPVGAVVLHEGAIIARRHNEREANNDPTAHAEILALRDAAAALGTWRLTNCTLVVTLEPCVMCAGAAWASRLTRVVYATSEPRTGALGSLYNIASDNRLNHEVEVISGVLAKESGALLTEFFANNREKQD